MHAPASLRHSRFAALLGLIAVVVWRPEARASSFEPLSTDEAPPPLSSVIPISGTSTEGVVGPVPFSPAAHDGVVRSQLKPKTGSYEVPNLDRDASVVFRFREPAAVRAVSIASSFEVTKRVHVDLLVGDEWVRAHEALRLTFSVGVPVLVTLEHSGVASAVRITSLDRHLFIDEFTAYAVK